LTNDVDDRASARSQLAATLRHLRHRADLSGDQLATLLGVSQSKVSRVENSRTVPSVAVVEAWARACGAPPETVEDLIQRAEAVLTEARTWRTELARGLDAKQAQIGRLEADAEVIRLFQPTLVPGLLQTAEYARRVFTLANPSARQDIAAGVAARLERQQVLFDDTKRFEFVIYEAALRWPVTTPVAMLGQLDRISSLLDLPHVDIGIIPLDGPAVTLLPPGFCVFGDDPADALVTVETLTAELHISDTPDVTTYLETFARLRQTAVRGADARPLLGHIAADFRR
jgi:transcriptional regulator with XRE-family HTH domain